MDCGHKFIISKIPSAINRFLSFKDSLKTIMLFVCTLDLLGRHLNHSLSLLHTCDTHTHAYTHTHLEYVRADVSS